jgi:hypothetical protein
MSIPVPVNIALNFSTGVLTHNVVSPPQIPAPVPMMSVEMIATQLWSYGYAMNQNKLTRKVLHKGMPIVQGGHDCGMMIPDMTPPMPANAFYPVMWPLSSRKTTFAASTVKMDKKPTACASGPFTMMTCGDPISAPTAQVHPTQLLNNVIVGMTMGDVAKGLMMVAVSMTIDFVFEYGFSLKGFKKLGKGFTRTAKEAAEVSVEKMTKELAETVGRNAAEEAVERATNAELKDYAASKVYDKLIKGHLAPTSPKGWSKKVLSDLSKFGISKMFDDNPTAKSKVGGPLLNVELSHSEDKGAKTTGQAFGIQRDTQGGGQNFGEPLP